MKTINSSNSPLAASPLVRPVKQLVKELTALVHAGHLQGIELDLTHAETPCFLLNVAPATPKLYIERFVNERFVNELFFDELLEYENVDDMAASLNVLMNWLNSDTEPTFWQTSFNPLDNALSKLDFTKVIDQILLLTEALPITPLFP